MRHGLVRSFFHVFDRAYTLDRLHFVQKGATARSNSFKIQALGHTFRMRGVRHSANSLCGESIYFLIYILTLNFIIKLNKKMFSRKYIVI